jgi:hypothetical protein
MLLPDDRVIEHLRNTDKDVAVLRFSKLLPEQYLEVLNPPWDSFTSGSFFYFHRPLLRGTGVPPVID